MPKPLVELDGKPFFWWAVESVARSCELDEISFVVLQEHQENFGISDRILSYYPEAHVALLPDVTTGSAVTASIGLAALRSDGVVAINDCDHAFVSGPMEDTVRALQSDAAAALMTFQSQNPAFSYVVFDGMGSVAGTVEKVVASAHAIAGCYLFSSREMFLEYYEQYLNHCPYAEPFISGVYNEILAAKQAVAVHELAFHLPFGTPEEFRLAKGKTQRLVGDWK